LIFIGFLIISSQRVEIKKVGTNPTPRGTIMIASQKGSTTLSVVERVIDGDTVVIDTGQKICYIGINTPEVETSECYATQASEMNRNLVLGKVVKLEKDISETDKYGRLLRYVYVGNIFINDELIKDGFAKIQTVLPDVKYQNQFRQSEGYARKNNSGLWEKCL